VNVSKIPSHSRQLIASGGQVAAGYTAVASPPSTRRKVLPLVKSHAEILFVDAKHWTLSVKKGVGGLDRGHQEIGDGIGECLLGFGHFV